MKAKVKLTENFKSDLKFWSMVLYWGIFIVCIWYSTCLFLIETLNFPIPTPKNNSLAKEFSLFFGTVYLVLFWIVYMLFYLLGEKSREVFNYIFTIEENNNDL